MHTFVYMQKCNILVKRISIEWSFYISCCFHLHNINIEAHVVIHRHTVMLVHMHIYRLHIVHFSFYVVFITTCKRDMQREQLRWYFKSFYVVHGETFCFLVWIMENTNMRVGEYEIESRERESVCVVERETDVGGES